MKKARVYIGKFFLGRIVENDDGEYDVLSPCHILFKTTTLKTFEEAVNFFTFSVEVAARSSIIVSQESS